MGELINLYAERAAEEYIAAGRTSDPAERARRRAEARRYADLILALRAGGMAGADARALQPGRAYAMTAGDAALVRT